MAVEADAIVGKVRLIELVARLEDDLKVVLEAWSSNMSLCLTSHQNDLSVHPFRAALMPLDMGELCHQTCPFEVGF